MTSARLAVLLGQARSRDGQPARRRRSAVDAWHAALTGHATDGGRLRELCGGRTEEIARLWAAAAARLDVALLWRRYQQAGVGVRLLGDPTYPAVLASDHEAPYVVLTRGSAAVLAAPRVAIVGTRSCTPAGREIAAQFGRELATAGVSVVSGLALGVDGAAHVGALQALPEVTARPRRSQPSPTGGPIGVVAGGLDEPYPARHRRLWEQVATSGLLVSEAPLGSRHEGWRFPARNRVIASLADVVVVVESHSTGGSMITADAALRRGRCVLAVPGSIRNPASAGTNQLLQEGAHPACSTDDILSALSLDPSGATAAADRRPLPSAEAGPVLAAVDWEPTPTETVLARTGLSPARGALLLAQLELDGWVRAGPGWWERLGVG